jgi:hypothetical protein
MAPLKCIREQQDKVRVSRRNQSNNSGDAHCYRLKKPQLLQLILKKTETPIGVKQ